MAPIAINKLQIIPMAVRSGSLDISIQYTNFTNMAPEVDKPEPNRMTAKSMRLLANVEPNPNTA